LHLPKFAFVLVDVVFETTTVFQNKFLFNQINCHFEFKNLAKSIGHDMKNFVKQISI